MSYMMTPDYCILTACCFVPLSCQVWWFIIHREVEAPDRFQAIQTYRAQLAILRQQSHMIEDLEEQGILEDADAEALEQLLQMKTLR